MDVIDRFNRDDRDWVHNAIATVAADANRSADTHLLPFPLTATWHEDCAIGDWDIQLYLKDESTHPSGSLKHRLARSLFLYALCNGWITAQTPIVEASSGSTAVSEAYFARMLGLRFIAVMPATTSAEKIELIKFYGGECHLVAEPSHIYTESSRLTDELCGHFMDQFTYSERATDWRGNNNIAESIYEQMAAERYPIPQWIVVGAGTGGTSATIGRYIRYQRHNTQLCVVDPDNSAFFHGWATGDIDHRTIGSRIEGIGRPRVEPSFVPSVIDRMMQVPDAASLAAMRFASRLLGRPVGGSTGTNLWGALAMMAHMHQRGVCGSVVTLLCDSGERYAHTYFNDAWLAEHNIDISGHLATLENFVATGAWVEPAANSTPSTAAPLRLAGH